MDDQRIISADAARHLGMDENTLRKYARLVGITPETPPQDRRLRTYSADDLLAISGRYADDRRKAALLTPDSPPRSADASADLQRIVRELAARVARLEARERASVSVSPSVPAQPLAAFSARPRPVLTRPLSKGLPDGLVNVREFANQHNIPRRTVERMIDRGDLPLVRGKWKVGSYFVERALDAAGRRQFYLLWGAREDWRRCAECPHEEE